jgi:hypothetical protein
MVTAANIDEHQSLWDITNNIAALLIADKGLIGKDYQREMSEESGINLQTPQCDNMTSKLGKDTHRWLVSTRRLVETVIGQLTEHFAIAKVRARNLWHFINRINRKILAHKIGSVLNKKLGNPPLQFEMLGIA